MFSALANLSRLSMRIVPAAICVVGAFQVFIANLAYAQATFTPLGTFGGTSSRATDVSADGSVVVGTIETPTGRDLFRWTPMETMVRNGAYGDHPAVSDDGSAVVGTFRVPPSPSDAFRWTIGGSFQILGSGVPFDVSSDGRVIVGDRDTGSFRWTESTGFVDLGTLPGGDNESRALAVSGDGSVVVGFADAANGRYEAYRWTSETGMVGLGLLPEALDSRAHGISADGSIVVGQNSFLQPPPGGMMPVFRSVPFRWTELNGMVRLFDLPYFYTTSVSDISADGSVVVGNIGRTSPFPGDPREGAFYWTEQTGVLILKEVLISAGATGLEGWTLNSANAVSADGRTIVGVATRNGTSQAFVATVPEPSTAFLAIIAAAALSVFYFLHARRMLVKH
jgi:probable HAF family extracellular repeat protein